MRKKVFLKQHKDLISIIITIVKIINIFISFKIISIFIIIIEKVIDKEKKQQR